VTVYTEEFYHLASRCDLSLTEEQQTAKYIHRLNYPIQERVAILDVFSVDEAQNKTMKIKRLRSRALPSRRPLSIKEPIGDDRVPPSSTTTGQPIVQPSAKASTLTPITNPVIAKGRDNPNTKHGVSKCYRCGKPGHRSNECLKRRPVNVADYEEKNDVLIEKELEDSDFTEEHGDPVTYVIQKVLCRQRISGTKQRH